MSMVRGTHSLKEKPPTHTPTRTHLKEKPPTHTPTHTHLKEKPPTQRENRAKSAIFSACGRKIFHFPVGTSIARRAGAIKVSFTVSTLLRSTILAEQPADTARKTDDAPNISKFSTGTITGIAHEHGQGNPLIEGKTTHTHPNPHPPERKTTHTHPNSHPPERKTTHAARKPSKISHFQRVWAKNISFSRRHLDSPQSRGDKSFIHRLDTASQHHPCGTTR